MFRDDSGGRNEDMHGLSFRERHMIQVKRAVLYKDSFCMKRLHTEQANQNHSIRQARLLAREAANPNPISCGLRR
jgi:hypothetical protein